MTRLLLTFLLLIFASLATAQDRAAKVRNDKKDLAGDKTWVYNDLPKAIDEAKRTKKPLFVVLRCIPCEACSEFDKHLLADDNEVKDLLDRFVCVRIVQANGLDLATFQFDYDQSFHVFFMNADKTVYGRFGTRSARPEEQDMTMSGLREAMLAALDLHAKYPSNKQSLAGKQGRPVSVAVPEKLPGLKGEYGADLDYDGQVVKSCIHCHQIRDAERNELRQQKKPFPPEVLYPYPLPEVIGLTLDPKKRLIVSKVDDGSAAAKAGLQLGDRVLSLAGQTLVSTADLQWVLHNAPAEGELVVTTDRNLQGTKLPLESGWREASDISWRATTWDLRRMATGGLWLVELSDDQRRQRGIDKDSLALLVKHAGEYGEHAAAKNAGFRNGDILIAVENFTTPQTESQFIAANLKRPRGEKVAVKIRRGDKTLDLRLPMQ